MVPNGPFMGNNWHFLDLMTMVYVWLALFEVEPRRGGGGAQTPTQRPVMTLRKQVPSGKGPSSSATTGRCMPGGRGLG